MQGMMQTGICEGLIILMPTKFNLFLKTHAKGGTKPRTSRLKQEGRKL